MACAPEFSSPTATPCSSGAKCFRRMTRLPLPWVHDLPVLQDLLEFATGGNQPRR